jgi:hypothetical protein
MFSVSMFERLLNPMPPTPMPAIWSLSLGALYPIPAITLEGRMVTAVAAIAVLLRKCLRLMFERLFSMAWWFPKMIG